MASLFRLAQSADDDDDWWRRGLNIDNPRDTTIQIVLSIAFGLSAFLSFCVLRTRWTGLYAARKKTKNAATVLPELPDTMFGWILPLWKVTDQQILASGGLDAYVFLAFFKMASKFLAITSFFSLVVIQPVHNAFPEDPVHDGNKTHGNSSHVLTSSSVTFLDSHETKPGQNYTLPPYLRDDFDNHYLWIYVVFAYVFSAIAIWLVIGETKRVIQVRQEYLGTSSTVTDRTIRLSGIPKELRDENKLKEFLESLDIGKVDRITLCRNWKELDDSMTKRMEILRRLEEAHTVYQGQRRVERNLATLPLVQPAPPEPRPHRLVDDGENAEDVEQPTLSSNQDANSNTPYARTRPYTRIWYGPLRMKSHKVDAIEYYGEQLQRIDAKIRHLRQKEFEPTALAFVTMDSVAACQMAIQAVLDPSPRQMIASQSPAPSDVIWRNTYMSRRTRMWRSWTITGAIVFLTVFCTIIFGFVATLLASTAIGKVFPSFEDFLDEHEIIKSLVSTQLPTIMTSIVLVAVPYLYYWLSSYQGMISMGDIELSAISKNFFFAFFNFFIVFTILGTAFKFLGSFDDFPDELKDIQSIASTLARQLQSILTFYANFIILQGVGLFPFRLLEAGSVSLYPIYRLGAKTPRDYAELVQPPLFSYGFYLPSALLIFIICMVYSVLRSSWKILLPGFIYFFFGHFVYKYQLLYAMDHQHASTGRAWGMICDRIFMGMIFFQFSTFGQLLLKRAYMRAVLIVPVLLFTIWVWIFHNKTYKPLMEFIALGSVKRGESYSDQITSPPYSPSMMSSTNDLAPERNAWAEVFSGARQRYHTETRNRYYQAVDESPEAGMRFINPSLVAPLKGVWIAGGDVSSGGQSGAANGDVQSVRDDVEQLALSNTEEGYRDDEED